MRNDHGTARPLVMPGTDVVKMGILENLCLCMQSAVCTMDKAASAPSIGLRLCCRGLTGRAFPKK